jgi:predicted transcriptional regulator
MFVIHTAQWTEKKFLFFLKKYLTSRHIYDIIQTERKKQTKKKEVLKMMNIDFNTYELIADLLAMGTDDEPTYSVEEIAQMCGVSVEMVQYVDRAENDIF